MRSYQRPSAVDDLPAAMRASVSFPAELYHALEEIARQKHVYLAWVVRDAAERYVAGEQKRHTARRRFEGQGREN
jgi:metal-responsive CopG/Arc/MetJ family transcriptional regulator